jgi:hypothetical protein
MATGVEPEWIEAVFDRKDYGVAPSLVFDDADFSNDVGSPERIHVETLVMAGLGMVAADDSRLTETFRNAVEQRTEPGDENGHARWFYPLLADTSGATNRIGSWLGDTSRQLPLLPPEVRPHFTQEAIGAMVHEACAAISAKEDERLSWMKLFAVYGDFPPATQALDAIQSALLAVDLAGYLKNDPWCGVAALRIISQHARYWSEPIRVNIETQLLELAKVIGETAFDPEVRRALTTSILDSLVSCTWWHAEGEARTIALARVLERLADTASPVFEGAGLLVLRLCDALPVREARHLWRVRDLLRRTSRL